MSNLAQIAVYGMAVMGKSLALNLANHGFRVGIYNRTHSVTEQVLAEHPELPLVGAKTLEELVASLERPRKIILLVKAGAPVDAVLEALCPLLEEGDILIDGGNSFFRDTERRMKDLEAKGLCYCGLGVSGGEKGALLGPALMPGCTPEVYEALAPYLQAIAAKAPDGEPCAAYLGRGGAGHYVKMVHNGIEYADMALLTEIYDLLHRGAGFCADELAQIFAQWNEGELSSYLLQITADILRAKDAQKGSYLLDEILDVAEQKGTGMWTNREAIERGVDCSILAAGLNTRVQSMLKEERCAAENLYSEQNRLRKTFAERTGEQKAELSQLAQKALYAARLLAYAQGFALYRAADEAYGWALDFATIAASFRAGCIIRSALLEPMRAAYKENPQLKNLMYAPRFVEKLKQTIPALRQLVVLALESGYAVPALSSALTYFDSLTRAQSAANMIQAQRDYFGAHTYRRIDRDGIFHSLWEDSPVDEEGYRQVEEQSRA